MVKVTSVLLAIIIMVILLVAILTLLSGVFPGFKDAVDSFLKMLKL